MYESEIEQITLDILQDDNGYTVLHGPRIVHGRGKERELNDAFLPGRLRAAINRLNPHIPPPPAKKHSKKPNAPTPSAC